jgi:hypothetical protein
LRGRVLSLYLFAFAGLAPLGSLFAGWLAEVGGTQLAFALAGVSGLLMTALAFAEIRPSGWRQAFTPALHDHSGSGRQ